MQMRSALHPATIAPYLVRAWGSADSGHAGVVTLALSRWRVLVVKKASVPPRQGINGLCPCPQN